MGHPLAAWFLLLLVPLVAVAEDVVHMKVESYNSSVVELSCSSKMKGLFYVQKGGYKCFNYDSNCSYYDENKDYCNNFSCKESEDPDVLFFQVELNGSCQEEIGVICKKEQHESDLQLKAQSDPPVISINNGNRVEAGTNPVPIVVTITNRCNDTDIEITQTGIQLPPSVSSHTKHGSRFTTTATVDGKFYEPGNYTITCKEKGKDGPFAKNLTIAVDKPKPKGIQTGSGMGHIAWVLFFPIIMGIGIGLNRYRRRRLVKKGKPEVLELKPSICGIWVNGDHEGGTSIQNFIEGQNSELVARFNRSGERAIINRSGKEVCRAEIGNTSFVQEDKNYAGYFALISSYSLGSEEFKTYLTSVIVRIQNRKNKNESGVVLVLLEEDILCRFDETWDENLMKNLRALPSVNAIHPFDNDCLLQISEKVQDSPVDTNELRGFGNTGVGLAWNYFRGYLAIILPGMPNRITQSEVHEKHPGKVNSRFIIIIPESGRLAAKLDEIDSRLSHFGPLDGGITESRAGHPGRPFDNFVHQFKRSEDNCYYFCGEYANPVSTLYKMSADRKLNPVEFEEQLQLFTQTLKAILQSHPCGENAGVFTFKENSTMADELFAFITTPNQPPSNDRNPVMQVTQVAEGLAQTYYYGYLTTIGPTMAERILKCDKQYSQNRMPTTFFILLPYSCYSHPTLESADKDNIKKVGDLKPHETYVAGNKRSYDTTIHQISSGSKTYHACVEYCTPVLGMYEMANEVGMSELQLAAELRDFYEILYDLLHGPSAPEYCRNFELIYYDDVSEGKRPLSEILVEKIEKSLGEEHKCLPKCLYACNP